MKNIVENRCIYVFKVKFIQSNKKSQIYPNYAYKLQGTWSLHTIRFASCVNRTEAHMMLFLQTFNLWEMLTGAPGHWLRSSV
jgi:hypothetical protein